MATEDYADYGFGEQVEDTSNYGNEGQTYTPSDSGYLDPVTNSPVNTSSSNWYDSAPDWLKTVGGLFTGSTGGNLGQLAAFGGLAALLNNMGGGSSAPPPSGYQGGVPQYTAGRQQYAFSPTASQIKPTPADDAAIRGYLTQPGLTDTGIASMMAKYGIDPARMAQATGLPEADIEARRRAVYGPNEINPGGRRAGEGGITYFSPMQYTATGQDMGMPQAGDTYGGGLASMLGGAQTGGGTPTPTTGRMGIQSAGGGSSTTSQPPAPVTGGTTTGGTTPGGTTPGGTTAGGMRTAQAYQSPLNGGIASAPRSTLSRSRSGSGRPQRTYTPAEEAAAAAAGRTLMQGGGGTAPGDPQSYDIGPYSAAEINTYVQQGLRKGASPGTMRKSLAQLGVTDAQFDRGFAYNKEAGFTRSDTPDIAQQLARQGYSADEARQIMQDYYGMGVADFNDMLSEGSFNFSGEGLTDYTRPDRALTYQGGTYGTARDVRSGASDPGVAYSLLDSTLDNYPMLDPEQRYTVAKDYIVQHYGISPSTADQLISRHRSGGGAPTGGELREPSAAELNSLKSQFSSYLNSGDFGNINNLINQHGISEADVKKYYNATQSDINAWKEMGVQFLAEGGTVGGRFVEGPGDGTSDDVMAMIGGGQPAALADGEFVIDARTVSELGNGSSKAGAQKLYEMMDRVHKARKTAGRGQPSGADRFLPR